MWPLSRPAPSVLPAWSNPAALLSEAWRVFGEWREQRERARMPARPTRHPTLPPAHTQPLALSNPILPALAALIPLLRGALHVCILDPLARGLIRVPRTGASAADERKVSKFAESAWKCLAYATLFTLGVLALSGSPWAPAPLGAPGSTLASARVAVWATGWPAAVALSPAAARYWTAQAAFYLSSLISLFAWEHRRSDFGVMVAHHLTTLALIGGASLARLEGPGITVAALHDPADIFLEGAKVASYAGFHSLATLCFVALALTWGATRLCVLPLLAADAWRAGCGGGAGLWARHAPPHIPAAKPLSILLWALVAMHTYWFALIARIAAGQLFGGEGRVTRDVREEDEVEENEVEAVVLEKEGMK